MSDHSHAHDGAHANDPHSLPHSHKPHYYRVGAALTVITAVEIGVLYVPSVKMIWVPLMFILAIVKFAVVVGEFMHLRPDQPIFKILFISPLFLALFSFCVLGVLAEVTYVPFGKGYAITAEDRENGYVPPSGGPAVEAIWAEDKLKTAFAAASAKKFEEGEKVFKANCVACHGPDGAGTIGVNLTDNCYKHGGTLANISENVTKGFPTLSPAMTTWGGTLTGEQIRQVSYYVRSLRGKNLPGKPCEGTPFND